VGLRARQFELVPSSNSNFSLLHSGSFSDLDGLSDSEVFENEFLGDTGSSCGSGLESCTT
jgi:hypothetical protein